MNESILKECEFCQKNFLRTNVRIVGYDVRGVPRYICRWCKNADFSDCGYKKGMKFA